MRKGDAARADAGGGYATDTTFDTTSDGRRGSGGGAERERAVRICQYHRNSLTPPRRFASNFCINSIT